MVHDSITVHKVHRLSVKMGNWNKRKTERTKKLQQEKKKQNLKTKTSVAKNKQTKQTKLWVRKTKP